MISNTLQGYFYISSAVTLFSRAITIAAYPNSNCTQEEKIDPLVRIFIFCQNPLRLSYRERVKISQNALEKLKK